MIRILLVMLMTCSLANSKLRKLLCKFIFSSINSLISLQLIAKVIRRCSRSAEVSERFQNIAQFTIYLDCFTRRVCTFFFLTHDFFRPIYRTSISASANPLNLFARIWPKVTLAMKSPTGQFRASNRFTSTRSGCIALSWKPHSRIYMWMDRADLCWKTWSRLWCDKYRTENSRIFFFVVVHRWLTNAILFICFSANVPNKTFNFDLELPYLQFSGDYTLALKLLLKISGNGRLRGSFSEFYGIPRRNLNFIFLF